MNIMPNEDDFSALFAPEDDTIQNTALETPSAWKILMVDDEADILAILRLTLLDMSIEGRTVQLFEAPSAAAAKVILHEQPDLALVLLDVVMETDSAGLELARHIRQDLDNHLVQIVLVTGQPGYAPQRKVIMDYEINGYRLKTELTAEKIFVTVYAAIRSHHTLLKVLQQQRQLDEAEQLAKRDSLMRCLVESSLDAIIGKTPDGIVTSWNPAAERIFAYAASEMLGRSIDLIIPADRREEDHQLTQAIYHGESISLFETQRLTKAGQLIDVLLTLSPIKDANSKVIGVSEIGRDISERKQAEDRQRLAATVFTHAREAILITDQAGKIIDVNDTFSRITGYNRDEVVGKNPRILKSGLHNQDFYAEMWKQIHEDGFWNGEFWNRHKDGQLYVQKTVISVVPDAHGKPGHYVELFSDVTLMKAHEQELQHLAHFDRLTNLPNRTLLADRMQQAMSQVERRNLQLGVVYLDLDGFKAVNDDYGHAAGDLLLTTLASRMQRVLREGDTLARMGGDEFAAILIDLANIEDSLPLLNRLLAAAAEPVMVGDTVLNVTASIGATFFPQTQEVDADQLLRQADQAMYQAKLSGKNHVHIFDGVQDNNIRIYHETLDQIRRALAENEFVLFYQPKVNMRSGAIIGVEALIRWQHPEKGLLPPAEFLPVIDDHPLAVDVGEWVLNTAMSQVEIWQQAGVDIVVSVNIGAQQLLQNDFVNRLQATLAAHPAIKPGSIELEMLETSALNDLKQASQVIKACSECGIKFALDDFGTGYSSLTYLKQLPVSQLKIDQSFVRDMLAQPDDLAILQGVLSLAGAFGREVIAEGVETQAHGELLLQLGCELAQGYGIARPMPAEEILAWTALWRPVPDWQNSRKATQRNL